VCAKITLPTVQHDGARDGLRLHPLALETCCVWKERWTHFCRLYQEIFHQGLVAIEVLEDIGASQSPGLNPIDNLVGFEEGSQFEEGCKMQTQEYS